MSVSLPNNVLQAHPLLQQVYLMSFGYEVSTANAIQCGLAERAALKAGFRPSVVEGYQHQGTLDGFRVAELEAQFRGLNGYGS